MTEQLTLSPFTFSFYVSICVYLDIFVLKTLRQSTGSWFTLEFYRGRYYWGLLNIIAFLLPSLPLYRLEKLSIPFPVYLVDRIDYISQYGQWDTCIRNCFPFWKGTASLRKRSSVLHWLPPYYLTPPLLWMLICVVRASTAISGPWGNCWRMKPELWRWWQKRWEKSWGFDHSLLLGLFYLF